MEMDLLVLNVLYNITVKRLWMEAKLRDNIGTVLLSVTKQKLRES